MGAQAAIGTIAFFGAALIGILALQAYLGQRREVTRSLRSIPVAKLAPEEIRRQALAEPLARRVIMPALRRLGHLMRRSAVGGVIARLDDRLAQAGSPAGWDAERLLALKALGAVGGAAAGLAFGGALSFSSVRVVLFGLAFGAAGYFAQEWVVRARANERQEAVRRSLPDSLDLLSITVQAGLGFDAAMARVARQATGPLGEELNRVVREMQLGKDRIEALRGMARRSSVPELKSFVLSMVQADIFGISVAGVLRVQAQELRTKRRQRAEEQAQKIPVKIVLPLVMCILPALFIVVLGPAAIQIFRGLFGGL